MIPNDLVAWLVMPATALLTWVGVACLRHLAPRLGFIDMPNERSSHSRPTPRAGGVAFVIACPMAVVVTSRWWGLALGEGVVTLLAGSLLVAAVGLADDRLGLPVGVRFVAYLAAALALVVGVGYLDELQWPGWPSVTMGWWGVPLTLLWIVGLTNVYNFMDGIDGIAASQALVAAAAGGFLALRAGGWEQALYMAAVAGGAFGFLLHNWPPARIFMGDVGSAFLGYSFAGLALLGGEAGTGAVPFWVLPLLLAPFLFDASYTLVARAARRERWWEAHRKHLYQRLVRRGWSHRAVTTVYLGASLLMAGLVQAHFAAGLSGWPFASVAMLPSLGILALVKGVERKGPIRGGQSPGSTPGGWRASAPVERSRTS